MKAIEIIEFVLQHRDDAPEKKRDAGSSLLTTLGADLEHKRIKIIDAHNVKPYHRDCAPAGATPSIAKFYSTCVYCGEPTTKGSKISFVNA